MSKGAKEQAVGLKGGGGWEVGVNKESSEKKEKKALLLYVG